MFPHLRILSPGAITVAFAANLFLLRADLPFALLVIGMLFLLMLLQHRWYKQARDRQARQHGFGKRVSEFAERLAVSPLERVDSAIVEGLDSIIGLVGADRICWYEVEEDSATLLHRYTASTRNAPASLKCIPSQKIPFIAEKLARHEAVALQNVSDLPTHAHVDAELLHSLGLKSLLLIPSNYSPRRKGVLGLAYYSMHHTWPEEAVHQLAIVANIIGATLERKYAETASQESEERFRYLFAQASIGIALETMEGRILEVNPAFCSMLGYSSEELLNTRCARISHPEDEEVEKLLFEELRQGLRPSYRLEKRFFRNDGSQMWGLVSVSLLNCNHGSPPLVIGMVSDVSAQKTAEACLYQRDQELQRLAGHLIEAQEEERRRISRDLHDDIGQRIALLACEIDFEQRSRTAPRSERKPSVLPKLRKEIDSIATDIHKLSHELHSASLQCCGLKIALKDLCWKYSHNHHLEIDLHTEKLDPKLPPDVALCLFRVAQEALANALKHSHTKRVDVNVVQDPKKVRLTVKDYGVGFDPSVQTGGIGLMSMRERLRFCGGMLTVRSTPNEGTEVAAEVVAVKRMAAVAST
jgi:PAS domain S-box-containing protein